MATASRHNGTNGWIESASSLSMCAGTSCTLTLQTPENNFADMMIVEKEQHRCSPSTSGCATALAHGGHSNLGISVQRRVAKIRTFKCFSYSGGQFERLDHCDAVGPDDQLDIASDRKPFVQFGR